MPTLKQLEEQGRALLENQKALVEDTRRPWSAKRAEFDKLDADIKAILEQHAAIKSVSGNPFLADAGSTGGAGVSRVPNRAAKSLAASVEAMGHHRIPVPQLDLGQDDLKNLYDAAVSKKTLSVDVKATDSTAIAPAAITDYRLPPVTALREPTRVMSLLPTYATSAPSVTWYSTTGTAAAAAVAEGGVKPTSTLSYTAQVTSATKIAHVAEVTDETLQDFSGFLSVLEADMVAGLISAENGELLNATVAGASKFPGLLNVSGILTRAKGTDTNLDALAHAFDDLRVGSTFSAPDGIVMHPTDWGTIRTFKDANGQYYIQPTVTDGPGQSIWGVPVVLTTQIPVGTALVGAFAASTALYVRDGIRVETANQGSTQFTNNTTLVRCEERVILTVPRPSGLVKVTGLV